MSKSIKLYSVGSSADSSSSRDFSNKKQLLDLRTFLVMLFAVLSFLTVLGIAVMAFYTSIKIFQELLAGLFIVGCILFMKAMSDEKTTIQRINRNIH